MEKIWDKVLEDIEELEKSVAVFKMSVRRFKNLTEKMSITRR